MDLIFPDNTVLCNFAAIDRLGLLRAWLRGRGRWTEAVAFEAERSRLSHPVLGELIDGCWLGTAIEISDKKLIALVERVRRTAFGGAAAEPLKHLGEAQSCVLISEVPKWKGSWWITDDRDAYDYAFFRGITVRRTGDILLELVADGDVTREQALRLLDQMLSADRRVQIPPEFSV